MPRSTACSSPRIRCGSPGSRRPGAYLDRMRLARDPLWRVDRRRPSRRRRRQGDRIPLPPRERRLLHGRVGRARARSPTRACACEELGYALTAAPGRFLRALVDAARGRMPRPTTLPRNCCSGRPRGACTRSPRTRRTSAACCSFRTAGSSRRIGTRHPSAQPAPSSPFTPARGLARVRPGRSGHPIGPNAEAAAHVGRRGGRARRALLALRTARRGRRRPHRSRATGANASSRRSPHPRANGGSSTAPECTSCTASSSGARNRPRRRASSSPRRSTGSATSERDHGPTGHCRNCAPPAAPIPDTVALTPQEAAVARPRGDRAHEQGDRRPAVPLPAHGVHAPVAGLPQARHHVAQRAPGCPRPATRRNCVTDLRHLTDSPLLTLSVDSLVSPDSAHREKESHMSATIVLVHGGFVDGSGWRGVYDELRSDGFDVRVVQNPTKSLADDAATTRECSTRRRPGRPRRPFLRRRGDHRGRHARQGRRPRLHHGASHPTRANR